MKAYTDLEQSRKLAEILPIESTDMFYSVNSPYDETEEEWKVQIGKMPKLRAIYRKYCPCWSLAALLDVLPPYLFEFERGIDLNVYPNLNGRGWHCSYMSNCIENMKTDKFKLITNGDTLVDACYEMIIKLHEQNLL